MKTLAQYTVVEEDDGSIRTYNNLKINAPAPISEAIAKYFAKPIRSWESCKGNPSICDCENCLKIKGEF